jgi:hypothetical protein
MSYKDGEDEKIEYIAETIAPVRCISLSHAQNMKETADLYVDQH